MLDARGHSGSVSFDGQTVTINRFGYFSGGATDMERFPLSWIRGIELRAPTMMLEGTFRVTVRRSDSDKRSVISVIFTRKQADEFKFMAAALEAAIIGHAQPTRQAHSVSGSASLGGQPPPPPPIPIPAGWYPDADNPGLQRYWDGNGWTEHTAPAAPQS